jgi:hypothetical protein
MQSANDGWTYVVQARKRLLKDGETNHMVVSLRHESLSPDKGHFTILKHWVRKLDRVNVTASRRVYPCL